MTRRGEWLTSSVRRAVDLVGAAGALLVLGPLIAVVAVLIRLDSRGPALFFHKRVGLHGRPFHLVKFRTHFVDADKRFPELSRHEYSRDEVADVHLQFEDDPRVTRLGRWLRQTSLDEFPNFWNVLVGEMSLVGPRPEFWEMYRYYEGEDLLKFSVKPGITGLAQISGRGTLSFGETNRIDLEYVRNRSLRGDLEILWRTVWMVVARRDAM